MNKEYDAIIIGGGIMGLLGAYRIVEGGLRVALIEKQRIGNKQSGSSGITRSLRTDYEDPVYAQLAAVAWDGWEALQQQLGSQLIVQTGCLNLGDTARNGNVTYAEYATKWLERDGRNPSVMDADGLQRRFPQFRNFDYATLESQAGIGLPKQSIALLRAKLRASGKCDILENTDVRKIRVSRQVVVETAVTDYKAGKLIIAAGMGSPALLQKIEGSSYKLGLRAERPAECVYYIPKDPKPYCADSLPAFACLDQGMYGHPIVQGMTKGVKIGRYEPPSTVNSRFERNNDDIARFAARYLPDLAGQSAVRPVTETDQCAYDMTADGGFAVGPIPGTPSIFVAAGFCGTGYKFAPVIAELMSDFAANTRYRYDIAVFDPGRPSLLDR